MRNVKVDANFPGGGVDQVRFLDDTTIRFEAPLDSSPQSLWYFFRISGAKGLALRLIQVGLEKVLGVFESRGYSPVVPVWKDASGWERVDERDCAFSKDPLQFSFVIEPTVDECYVAFCFPYTLADAERFFNSLPAGMVSRKTIGKTKQQRPHPAWIVGNPNGAEVKNLVVLSARQHAGEVPGSFVLEGFLRELTGGSDLMVRVLRTTLFLVVPIVDLDCVEDGCYGKDQRPIDFNRDWSHYSFHPEIRNIVQEIDSLNERYRLVWACDFHAPQPGGASYMPPSKSYAQDTPEWNRMWNLALRFEEKCQGTLNFSLHDVDTEVLNWGGLLNPSLINALFKEKWGCVSDCYEFSYHRDSRLKIIGKDEWDKMGRLLARSAVELLLEPGLGASPVDISRLPPWTIPPNLQFWKTTRKVKGFELKESRDSLELTPSHGDNFVWATSPLAGMQPAGAPVLKLAAAGPCQVGIYTSIFQDGLLVKHHRQERLHFSGEYLYLMPAGACGGDQFSVSVIAENIPAAVRLTLMNRRDD